MRTVAVGFSAGADGRAFTVDRDTVLSYVAAGAKGVISTDPQATIGNVITAPQNISVTNILMVTAVAGQFVVDVPLSAGETIFLCYGGVGQLVLQFTDPQ